MKKYSKHSLATRTKMSLAKKGRRVSPLALKHLLEMAKKRIGQSRPPFSKECKEKMSLARKSRIKESSPNWRGGLVNDPDYNRNRQRVWMSNPKNYERKIYLNKRRRVLLLGNGGSHTLIEWQNLKAQYNWTCPHCKRAEPIITLSEDHIIPLSKGGSDNIENIQPLCRSCNSSKGNKI